MQPSPGWGDFRSRWPAHYVEERPLPDESQDAGNRCLAGGRTERAHLLAERWYGFDDGLYTAARLVGILGVEDRHSDEGFEDFPEDISTPELNVQVTESDKFAIIERL